MKTQASEEGLGRVLEQYTPSAAGIRINLAAGIIIPILGIIALSVGVIKFEAIGLICLPIGITLLPVGIWGFFTTRKKADYCVKLYREGFSVTLGGHTDTIRFEDVAAYYSDKVDHFVKRKLYAGTSFYFRVVSQAGHDFTFDEELLGFTRLSTKMKESIIYRVSPQITEAFDEGATIPFGQVSLNVKGIQHKEKFVEWKNVHAIKFRVKSGVVVIEEEENWLNWATIKIAKIPNLEIFRAITQRMANLVVDVDELDEAIKD